MEAKQLQEKYYGDYASNYEQRRKHTREWLLEEQAVSGFLSRLQPGASVLDVPVGTGRFLNLYGELMVRSTGIDASTAMLEEARAAAGKAEIDADLSQGDIRSLPFDDDQFDAAVCIRFLNWISMENVEKALRELKRVTRGQIVFGVKVYPSPASMGLRLPGGTVRALRQAKHRFYMYRKASRFLYHESSQLRRLLDALDLSVVEYRLILENRRGYDYFIYLVEKGKGIP